MLRFRQLATHRKINLSLANICKLRAAFPTNFLFAMSIVVAARGHHAYCR